jgi:hypothetical protein
MDLHLTLESLNEVISLASDTMVSTLMKRFEIIEDKEVLKKITKEQIHEGMKHTRDLLVSAGRGIEPRIFVFKSKKDGKNG